MDEKFKSANLKIHVDDSSFCAVGDSFDDLLQKLVLAEAEFAKKVKLLKLKLSPKGAVVTSHEKLTQSFVKELKLYGVKLVAAKHTRDLGVTFSAGVNRPSRILCKRIKM